MRLALVTPAPTPPVRGGAERAWTGIARAFNELTAHRCEIVAIPTPEATLADVARSYLRCLDTVVDDFDAVLTCKYPAWMVEHPFHDVFLFHRLRGLYDTYPAQLPSRASIRDPELAPLLRLLRRRPSRADVRLAAELTISLAEIHPGHPALGHPGPVGRELIRRLDRVGLQPTPNRRYAALSRTVAGRHDSLPAGVPVQIVELPTDLPGLGPGSYEHFFLASRLDRAKRVDLVIRAYRSVPGDVPLYIAGTGPEGARLAELAEGDDRVHLLGEVDDGELARLYRGALAVPFVPQDEDWGLVAVEALASATPVVTCRDSGGPTELIEHGRTGFVVEPAPAALAATLTRLARERGLAERLGEEGLRRSRQITWQGVVEALDPERGRASPRAADPTTSWRRHAEKAVVLSTFPVHPARHGGQLRSWHLYRSLADRMDLELVCLGGPDDAATAQEVETGIFQRVVPRSARHRELEMEWDGEARVAVGDIVAGQLLEHTPRFEEAAQRALADCDLVVLAHPFLLEVALRHAAGTPFVYDAHNCELDLKRSLLADAPAAPTLLARVEEIEGRATREGARCIACSTQDAQRLADLYGVDPATITVIPNGVDVGATPWSFAQRRRSQRRWLHRLSSFGLHHDHLAVFIGSFHNPNILAAQQIIAMAPDHPSIAFALLGAHCDGLRATEVPPNVLRVGVVSEPLKHGFLRAASVALNPVTSGSGTNLKLVEFLAAGVPTVTTPVGARGLPLVDGIHARVVEQSEMGKAIDDLVRRPDPAMVEAARALVAASFDWSILGPRFVDAVVGAGAAHASAP